MPAYPKGLSRKSALMAVAVALPVLHRAYRAAADKAVAHLGMTHALAWPLVMVGRQGGGMRQGVLADRMGIEAPSLVRPLDQLVEAGFIERREDAVDRRAKTLHLTDSGAAACAQLETALSGLRVALFEGVADADVAACLRVFAVLELRLGATVSGLAPYAEAVADLPAR